MRHLIYKCGNTQEQSLDYCHQFDKIKNPVEEISFLKEVLDKCKNKNSVKYVREGLANKLK